MNKFFWYFFALLILCSCATSRTASKKQGSYYFSKRTERKWSQFSTPQQYGAKGDGLHDDRESIQSCLDKGGNIYFPEGTYLISNIIYVKNNGTHLYLHPNAIIECNNVTQSVGLYGNAGATLFFSPWYYAMGDETPLLKDVGIEGGVVRNTSPKDNENAIGFMMCDSFYCRNVTIPYCNRKGITIQHLNRNGVIENNSVENAGLDGITIEDRNVNIVIRNNIIGNVNRRAVYITGCDSIFVEKNLLASNDDAVYSVKSNVSIKYNTVSSVEGRSIAIIHKPEHYEAKKMVIIGNKCESKSYGVYIGRASEEVVLVEGNKLNNDIIVDDTPVEFGNNKVKGIK